MWKIIYLIVCVLDILFYILSVVDSHARFIRKYGKDVKTKDAYGIAAALSAVIRIIILSTVPIINAIFLFGYVVSYEDVVLRTIQDSESRLIDENDPPNET